MLALACGVAVSNIYFPQPLTPLIAADLRVPLDTAAFAVTATQFGYAGGIFLLVPLGDRLPHRRLLVSLLTVATVSLLAAAIAPSLPTLVIASALVGLTTVAAPIIGSMAAGLTAGNRIGAVSGTLLSGSIGGILLGRVAAGRLGERLGWRAPYLAAAVLTLLVAAALARVVPMTTPRTRQRYTAILAEPLPLLRNEPALRRSCLYQACVFAGFSAVWTSLPQLLTGPTYGLTTNAVSAFGLISAATMICTPLAGRLVDRGGPDPVNLICLIGTIASAPVLAAGVLGGPTGLIAITIGILLLDITMQSGMTANLTRIYAIRPDSRLNTAYMTCAFIGSSTGSWLGALLCNKFGWPAVSTLVALTAAIALTRHLTPQRNRVNQP